MLDGVVHEGILRVELLTNAEQGPALVFEHDPDAERLDHFLERRKGDGPDLATRLDMLRQLAETLKYAHERRLYHRALSPRKVPGDGAGRLPAHTQDLRLAGRRA